MSEVLTAAKVALMQDRVRAIARRLAETGGPAVTHTPAFVSATEPRMEDVTTNPENCGSDYWEIVIEDSDL